MTGPVAETRPPRRRSLVVLTILTVAALAVLLALGTWQVRRLAWKEALIARVDERIHAAPQPLPAADTWPALKAEEIEYRPVTVTGRFDHAHELRVFMALAEPRGRYGGQGWFILTPLQLAGSDRWVLVNRGFVPQDRGDPASRPEGQVSGEVTLTGLMRPPEPRTWLSPADDPARNVWFVRDPATMAKAVGLDPSAVAPFTIDAAATAPGDLPQGGETVVAFTNNHLGYAITWYGLAAALAAVYVLTIVRSRTPR